MYQHAYLSIDQENCSHVTVLQICSRGKLFWFLYIVKHLHKDGALFDEQFYSRKVIKNLVHHNEEKSTHSENKRSIA